MDNKGVVGRRRLTRSTGLGVRRLTMLLSNYVNLVRSCPDVCTTTGVSPLECENLPCPPLREVLDITYNEVKMLCKL